MKPRKARVRVEYEDGGVYNVQGVVHVRERTTQTRLDGQGKDYNLTTSDICVIIKDELPLRREGVR
jgi:hypothetical protein